MAARPVGFPATQSGSLHNQGTRPVAVNELEQTTASSDQTLWTGIVFRLLGLRQAFFVFRSNATRPVAANPS